MELTRAEEKVMQVLWEMGKGFVKDIVAGIDEHPKPAYTTVSTIVRILEQKGFIGHTAYGKSHEYYPLIAKSQYRKKSFGQLLQNYFNGNPAEVLSYMVQEEQLNAEEIAEIKNIIARAAKNK